MRVTMVHGDTAAELFAKAQDGDRPAFDALVAGSRDRLTEIIQGRIGNHLGQRLTAEDVLQETYLRAFQSLPKTQWRGEAAFNRWLQAIAENRIVDAARRCRIYPELSLSTDLPGAGTSPSRRYRREERFDRLKESLAVLSDDHRQVILLARIEGLTSEEIAARMHRTVPAVRNLLFRAMKELRKTFGDTESFSLPDRSIDDEGSTHEC